ncbi:MAG: peptide-N-glycosidase F-related protein [Bacteroidetes bacterium]|nr:peptide-N-glycosidase F-related protein [Bacteroidota bacterium]
MKNTYLKFSIGLFVLFFLTFNNVKSQTNQYLDFDGVDDWVSVNNGSQLIANSTQITIAGWFFNKQLGGTQGLIGFRTATQTFNLSEIANGVLQCRLVNSSNVQYQVLTAQNAIIPNVWQHWAWVYDGSTVKLYLNGILNGSTAASGVINLTTIPFAIGKATLSPYNFYFNGRIDEVSLWNKALTQAEIQNMIQNELTGNETGLQLYFKFNQGSPGNNNTGISKLHSEVNSPTYDGDILNFALNGATSNFNGTLNASFQAISFTQIPTKLTTSSPFALNAVATSGLPVSFTVLSGPATLSNDSIITVTGAGTVKIRAYQNGNAQYDSAVSVINTFDVVNPAVNVPNIDPRHPLAGNVYMPSISKIQLAALATINYSPLFSIQELHFKINGTTIPAHDFGNGHFTAWWQPSAYGNYTIEIYSTNNFGAIASKTVNVNILATSNDTTFQAFSGVINNSTVTNEVTVDCQLPSYVGAYDTIIATLNVSCPPGGCGAWDYMRSIKARSHEGNWFEVIRYVTPYGTACSHKINLTDYASILNGKVSFKIVGLDNGYYYALSFDYKSGTPPYKYSQINQIWDGNYDFGNYAHQQPVGVYNYTFPANVQVSKLKLISTGHAGPSNTSNAAEFYDATHHIYINNVNTYTQHNWTTCNPNSDNCMPQSGTWQYSRAGWCPGSIAKPFDFNIAQNIITGNTMAVKYVFYEGYIDQCNPYYPGCVSGTTCSDCAADAQPFLVVNCNLVNFFDVPPPDPQILNIEEPKTDMGIFIYPNPSNGKFNLTAKNKTGNHYLVSVYNLMGKQIKQFEWNGDDTTIDISIYPSGIYLMKIGNNKVLDVKKLIVR